MTVEGPRFSSKAESHMFRLWGADVINMTTVPEVRSTDGMGDTPMGRGNVEGMLVVVVSEACFWNRQCGSLFGAGIVMPKCSNCLPNQLHLLNLDTGLKE